jgi:uncharacterized protein (UPF0276 family)
MSSPTVGEELIEDRVGLAWRDELAPQIHLHLDAIDHLEVLADREFGAPRRRIDALRELARQVPVSLHGVSMGLASSGAVEESSLLRMAKLVARVEPDHWSEHLAFVRAGGFEIGHLAAAPYAPATLEGTLRNLERARRVVGCLPHVENVAALLLPPGSHWSEEGFICRCVRGSRAPLLLDLHNLYANAWNFGRDPFAMLLAMPLENVRSVHLSGGRVVREPGAPARLIDDHLHDPPPVVYDLLEALAQRAPHGLTVIVERDGHYPEFARLLHHLAAARTALAAGRRHRHSYDQAASARSGDERHLCATAHERYGPMSATAR